MLFKYSKTKQLHIHLQYHIYPMYSDRQAGGNTILHLTKVYTACHSSSIWTFQQAVKCMYTNFTTNMVSSYSVRIVGLNTVLYCLYCYDLKYWDRHRMQHLIRVYSLCHLSSNILNTSKGNETDFYKL